MCVCEWVCVCLFTWLRSEYQDICNLLNTNAVYMRNAYSSTDDVYMRNAYSSTDDVYMRNAYSSTDDVYMSKNVSILKTYEPHFWMILYIKRKKVMRRNFSRGGKFSKFRELTREQAITINRYSYIIWRKRSGETTRKHSFIEICECIESTTVIELPIRIIIALNSSRSRITF